MSKIFNELRIHPPKKRRAPSFRLFLSKGWETSTLIQPVQGEYQCARLFSSCLLPGLRS